MTTMKDGPGDDPFGDDASASEPAEETEPETTPERDSTTDTETEPEPESSNNTMATNQIPYVMRRETVKEDRTNELVTFARDEYDALEDQVHADVADEMGMSMKDVPLTDVREALIELGDRHSGELAEILLDWGHEHRQ